MGKAGLGPILPFRLGPKNRAPILGLCLLSDKAQVGSLKGLFFFREYYYYYYYYYKAQLAAFMHCVRPLVGYAAA